jgi:hypothetical protein
MSRRRACCFLICLAAMSAAGATELEELAAESRALIRTFAERLQQELQQALAQGGPVAAIEVCKVKAPQIATELSTGGWSVRRTSLKVRNPANAPDAFEEKVLQDFEAKRVEGWDHDRLAYYKMQEIGTRIEYRYLKAIPTQEQCLVCHGEHIPDDVRAKLDALYPGDQARGFKAGDIRGAFSLIKRYERGPEAAPQAKALPAAPMAAR